MLVVHLFDLRKGRFASIKEGCQLLQFRFLMKGEIFGKRKVKLYETNRNKVHRDYFDGTITLDGIATSIFHRFYNQYAKILEKRVFLIQHSAISKQMS